MPNPKSGQQTIGCEVTSCTHYYDHGCALSHIQVEPQKGCHTGEPCDESLCGSYLAR